MNKLITKHHMHNEGYIMLKAEKFAGIPLEVSIGSNSLHLKSEFHVSLIALKYIIPLINANNGDVLEDCLVEDFINFHEYSDLSAYSLSNDYRWVKRGERESLVAMVDVPNLADMFEYFSHKYETNLPVQPAHITLYTLQQDVGIGVLSEEELNRDSIPVTSPF